MGWCSDPALGCPCAQGGARRVLWAVPGFPLPSQLHGWCGGVSPGLVRSCSLGDPSQLPALRELPTFDVPSQEYYYSWIFYWGRNPALIVSVLCYFAPPLWRHSPWKPSRWVCLDLRVSSLAALCVCNCTCSWFKLPGSLAKGSKYRNLNQAPYILV